MTKALVLTGISGSKVGVRHMLTDRTNVIGSAPGCALVLQDRLVSLRHAEIRQVLERWFVAPLDTNSQVYVNGLVVSGQSRMMEGCTLTIGTATFTVAFSDIAEQEVGSQPHPSSNGVPRMGDYLIKKGVVSRSQVQHAAQHQSDLERKGRRLQFGDVLYELGYASRSQLDQAVADQRNEFYEKFRD